MVVSNREEPVIQVPVTNLDHEHFSVFDRAVKNVLGTDQSLMAMAQLIDGLPLDEVARSALGARLCDGHPIYQHKTLCEGVIEGTKAYRDAFDSSMLNLPAPLVQKFQNATINTRQFEIRLIEMVVVSVHHIAALLFQSDEKLHKGDICDVTQFREESGDELDDYRRPSWLEPLGTLFFHLEYINFEQYPLGIADAAGYWAEDLIFGGVVLFQRDKLPSKCEGVFMDSGRAPGWTPAEHTSRIWRLREEQRQSLVSFLTAVQSTGRDCPLPLYSNLKNWRMDHWDAMAIYHIFRDPWERKLRREKDESNVRRNVIDYPELENVFTLVNSGPEYDMPNVRQPMSGFESASHQMSDKDTTLGNVGDEAILNADEQEGPVRKATAFKWDNEPPTPCGSPPSGVIWEEFKQAPQVEQWEIDEEMEFLKREGFFHNEEK
ncbi:hypothetical protein GGR57DRAFT_488819 [Xylariaceae sp. FL1272]|nr:hypothetical protein GGR57DRAFT_488819 [Xylariaceae sp. FL1272]